MTTDMTKLKLLLLLLLLLISLFIYSGEMVQLFYKYNLDVTYCSSGAIVAAVFNDFKSVVFAR